MAAEKTRSRRAKRPKRPIKADEPVLSKATMTLRTLTTPAPPQISVDEFAALAEVTQQCVNGWLIGKWSPGRAKRKLIEERLAERGIELPADDWLVILAREKRKPIRRKRRKAEAAE